MHIEVNKQISETEKEVYKFAVLGLTAVFESYSNLVIQSKIWVAAKSWHRTELRSNNIKEPELPDTIRSLALDQIIKLVRVKTWAEYKTPSLT